MFETLYKTDVPGELERAEYYQPNLDVEYVNGSSIYFVSEKHGWFSDTEKKAFHHLSTLSPDEGFANFEEAKKRYDEQIEHRASEGFIHSFSFDPYSQGGICYRRLK